MNRLAGRSRIDVLSLLARPRGNIGVELGVAAGSFSAKLLESGRFARLFGVDAYSDHHDVDEYRGVLRRMRLDARYALLRMRFNEALDVFDDSSLDFVYIDGYAHTGQEGGATIWHWAPKVKLGGVLSGHDYSPAFPLTIRAVDRFVAETGFEVHVTGDAGEDHPTWAVVKTAATPLVDPPMDLRLAGRRATALRRYRHAVAKPVKRILQWASR